MLEYKTLNIITSAISLVLFVCLLFIPELIFWLFQIKENEPAFFVALRASMLFLGYAIIFYFSRNSNNSEARQAILLGFFISMLGLALLGVFEFFRGFVGYGIFLAISTELFLAASYFSIWIANRKKQ